MKVIMSGRFPGPTARVGLYRGDGVAGGDMASSGGQGTSACNTHSILGAYQLILWSDPGSEGDRLVTSRVS